MNTDIGELIEGIEIEDPVSVAIVIGLVVSVVLFGVVAVSLAAAILERGALQKDYESTVSSIERIRAAQAQRPETLRQRIGEAQEELESLLAGMPTRREVREEMGKYYTYAGGVDVELVRVERVAVSEEEGEGYYDRQRFLLEARGLAHNLMRFLARVGHGPYDTFLLSDIRIEPDGPSTANAALEVFSSELSLDEPLPAPPTTEEPPAEEGKLDLDDSDLTLASRDGVQECAGVKEGEGAEALMLEKSLLRLQSER